MVVSAMWALPLTLGVTGVAAACAAAALRCWKARATGTRATDAAERTRGGASTTPRPSYRAPTGRPLPQRTGGIVGAFGSVFTGSGIVGAGVGSTGLDR